MERITPKTRTLLKLCERPSRFVDILRGTGFTTEGLRSALKRLQERGIIRRLEDGRYVLTDKGRELLEDVKAVEAITQLSELHKEIRELRELVERYG